MDNLTFITSGDKERMGLEYNKSKCGNLLALIDLGGYTGSKVIIGIHGSLPFVAVYVGPEHLPEWCTNGKWSYLYDYPYENIYWIEHPWGLKVLPNLTLKEDTDNYIDI